MNKKILHLGAACVAMVLWIVSLSAQRPGTLWTRTYGRADRGSSAQQISGGGYIPPGPDSHGDKGQEERALQKVDNFGPSVAYDGANYLVVWEDGYNIYGSRVDPSANVLDPEGFEISAVPGVQAFPSVAFDGANYLVVWFHFRELSGEGIFGARVDPSGTVLDPGGVPISFATDHWYGLPSVAFDGTNYLVAWGDNRYVDPYIDIYGARVDQSGSVLDSSGFGISTAPGRQSYPSVAFDGTHYLVVWEDLRSGSSRDIYGARVDQFGGVFDPEGIAICTAARDQTVPSVAFDGTHCLVVWEHSRSGTSHDIYGARVDSSANVLDPEGFEISGVPESQGYPSVAFGGADYLVVWHDSRDGHGICGARVDRSAIVLDPDGFTISTVEPRQLNGPSVAFDGTHYLVVWVDLRSGSEEVYGARVDQSGNVIDPYGLAISTTPACGDCNGDFEITVADAICLASFVYERGPRPFGEGDVNQDARITIADATYIAGYIHRRGPEPCNP